MYRVTAILLLAICAPLCHAIDRPNVIIVMTDDQGYGDFSLHGNPHLETPNLDQFAREGIRFSQFQVSPFCAPTRASLLTGRYSLRTGTVGVTSNLEVMRSSEVTLAEALRTAGYRSTCIGKWHNGEQFPHNAIGQGFDEFFGFNAGHWNNYFDATLTRGHTNEKTNGYITDVLTDEAIRFIEKCTGGEKNAPFFCYLSLNAPHTPSQAPQKYFDRYKAKNLDDQTAAIYAMCTSIDENFGKLMSRIDEVGIRENTIVFFLTDNGANTEHFNAGMRGRKVSVHEGGTRVPLFVQWPARWQKPGIVDQLAAHIDLFPTIMELCDVEPPRGPPVDGLSLVPWLNDTAHPIKPRQVFLYNAQRIPPVPFGGAVRTNRFRAVCEDRRATLENARWQLYDMSDDPGQQDDIADDHPQVVAELANEYEKWWRDASGGLESIARIEIGHKINNPVTLHAPQAIRQIGLKYGTRLASGRNDSSGYANDFLTGWNSTEARVDWAVDIVSEGKYRVQIVCNVNEGDQEAVVQVSCAGKTVEGKTGVFPGERLRLPHLVEDEHVRYINRSWDLQELGEIDLSAGSSDLTIRAITKPGTEVMKLKEIVLTKLP